MIAEFKKIGDWDKVLELTKNLDKHIYQGSLKGQLNVAKRLEKIVKEHLVNQDLKWKKLSKSYQRRKRDNKDRILVERWKYYEAIKTERIKGSVLIGVRKDRYYVGKGRRRIALYKVAALHESGLKGKLFGKYDLPKRPLWTPSFKELTRIGIDELIVKEMRNIFLAKGWGTVYKNRLKKYGAPL